jgi:hypothetical protein
MGLEGFKKLLKESKKPPADLYDSGKKKPERANECVRTRGKRTFNQRG